MAVLIKLLSKEKLTQKETIELQDRAMFALEATEGMYVSILEDPSLIGTLVMSPETEAIYQARIKSIQNFKDRLNEQVLEKVEASQKALDRVEPPKVEVAFHFIADVCVEYPTISIGILKVLFATEKPSFIFI